jgi:Na+/melibiose symporter-like transporter
VAMYFYPLRPGVHEKIVAELAARRASRPEARPTASP